MALKSSLPPPPAPAAPAATPLSRAWLGRRGDAFVQQVCQATATRLGEVGYAALRIEDVAARAGVNKTSIYRRWPSKLDLVRAMLELLDVEMEAPDTGSLRDDFNLLLRKQIEDMSSPEGRGIVRLMMTDIPELNVAQIAQDLRGRGCSHWESAVARAVERGEVAADVDGTLLADVVGSTLFTRLCKFEMPVDDTFIEALLDFLMNGVRRAPRDAR